MKTLNTDDFAPRFTCQWKDGKFQAIALDPAKILADIRSGSTWHAEKAWNDQWASVARLFTPDASTAPVISHYMPKAA